MARANPTPIAKLVCALQLFGAVLGKSRPSSSFEALVSSLLLMLVESFMSKPSAVVVLIVVVVVSGKVLVDDCCPELAVVTVGRVPGKFIMVVGKVPVVVADSVLEDDIVVVVLEDADVEVASVLVVPRAVETQTRNFEPDAAASATPR